MEQQEISVAKAGLRATSYCRAATKKPPAAAAALECCQLLAAVCKARSGWRVMIGLPGSR
jgi:hypothetical protein